MRSIGVITLFFKKKNTIICYVILNKFLNHSTLNVHINSDKNTYLKVS